MRQTYSQLGLGLGLDYSYRWGWWVRAMVGARVRTSAFEKRKIMLGDNN
jgi:hypothetical protein